MIELCRNVFKIDHSTHYDIDNAETCCSNNQPCAFFPHSNVCLQYVFILFIVIVSITLSCDDF